MTTDQQVEAVSSDEKSTLAADEQTHLQLVTFEIDQEEFAVDILTVQEINRMMQITPVPEAPAWVEGVINLRGRIITVIDLRRRFSLPELERSGDQRIIVVEIEGKTIGFVVDRVNEVLRIHTGIIEPTPDVVNSRVKTEYIEGVGMLDDRLLILLNIERLFNDDMTNGAATTQRAA